MEQVFNAKIICMCVQKLVEPNQLSCRISEKIYKEEAPYKALIEANISIDDNFIFRF